MPLASDSNDPSKTIAAVWIPIIISAAVALGGSFSWVYAVRDQDKRLRAEQVATAHKENERLQNEFLARIELKLQETKSLHDQLYSGYLIPGWGILESYVIKARRPEPDTALMFQIISRMVQRDSEILALLEGYEPYAITTEFKQQSAAFREHAEGYALRFEAIPKMIPTKEKLPPWEVFPKDFPRAVELEAEARKKLAGQ